MLYQVAESLETNYAACIGTMEERLAESRSVFDATVAELTERLAGQFEDCKQALGEQQQSNALLRSENDGLPGQVTRLEVEHKGLVERLRAEAREHVRHDEEERSRLTKEHRAELAELQATTRVLQGKMK